MSADKKRSHISEGKPAVAKKAKLEVDESPSSEQEISVHPNYDDDDFELNICAVSAPLSDIDSPELQSSRVADNSPLLNIEQTSSSVDSQAFPLSKPARESGKQRRHYRGAVDSSADRGHDRSPRKRGTHSTKHQRQLPERDHSRSHSKSPIPHSLKSKSLSKSSSTGRSSPLVVDMEPVEYYRHSDGDDRTQSKYDRPWSSSHKSQRGSREVQSSHHHEGKSYRTDKSSYREGYTHSDRNWGPDSREEQLDHPSLLETRHRSVDVGSLYRQKEPSRSRSIRGLENRDVDMRPARPRSPSRAESFRDEIEWSRLHKRIHGSDRFASRSGRQADRDRRLKDRETEKKKKHKHHRHADRLREPRREKIPTVVVSSPSSVSEDGETREVKRVSDKIEDLLEGIEEESTSESSEESVDKEEITKSGRARSVSSDSSQSDSEAELEDSLRKESRNGSTDTVEDGSQEVARPRTLSESEGEVRSSDPDNVATIPERHVIHSRFDTSDHSSFSGEEDQAGSQPGRQPPGYGGYLEELSEDDSGSVMEANTPEVVEEIVGDAVTAVHSPSPTHSPQSELPLYLPALMGCRNVESYQWLDRIEEGTYGVVYKAKDKKTQEIVALKKLKMEKEKEGFPITSLREINMLLKAEHPNIVRVREIVVGSNMDKIYIVMDFIKHDLKALMSTMKEKFLEGEVKTLLLHLLRAVHHLHDNWILHRDLKTSNLLLSHDNILKVADFGLAREYGSPLLNYTPVVVTLWYRAPELLLGTKLYSTAIDMWSVGCIFAELLLHKPLLCGRSEIDQLNKIFTVLGTPNEKVWPGFNELSGSKNVTFTKHPPGNLLKTHPSLTTKSGFDLLLKLLTYDPTKRISAKEALEHAYFNEMPRPVPPEMFPTWPSKSEIAKNKRKREKSPTPPKGGAFIMTSKDQASPGVGFSLKFQH